MTTLKLYKWHPCGDVTPGANGLIVVYGDDKGLDYSGDRRISLRELCNVGIEVRFKKMHDTKIVVRRSGTRTAEYTQSTYNYFVSEHVMEALVIWNARGFESDDGPTTWEGYPARRIKAMPREDFLRDVAVPAFALDTEEAIRAAGGKPR